MAVEIMLDENQMWRLSALLKLEKEPLKAFFVDVDGSQLTKVKLVYLEEDKVVYLTREHYKIIRNGLKVTRAVE